MYSWFCRLYCSKSVCFEQQRWQLYRWCGCSTETERRCHTTAGVGSRRGLIDTGSEYMTSLGARKLHIQACYLRVREAICWEITAAWAAPGRSLTAPSPRINSIADALLRYHYNACHWGKHEALVWETRPARWTLLYYGNFSPFNVDRSEEKKFLYHCLVMVGLCSLFYVARSIRASPYLAGMEHDVHLAAKRETRS